FRVSIRRLRSWVKAFRPSVDDDVTRKWRRRLAEIADATRATRDGTVHLEWLRKERPSLSARQRAGQKWLGDRLASQRSDGAEDALGSAADFASMIPKLTRKLSFYRAPVCEPEPAVRFGSIVAETVRTRSERLRRDLAAVHAFSNVKKAHRARISAKNLRYVIDPVAKLVGGGDAIIETLKSLQDCLGDLHDVHVFTEELATATEKAARARSRRVSRDPGPGLLRLAERLHERGMQSFAAVEHDWLNEAGADFFERVNGFAAGLVQHASVGAELEHKSLATRLPAAALEAPPVGIELMRER
ncbi:MAG TPA: CHAD domain-containing protein, partial [Gemmatimonadaceae bacterium]|nr:CHAD domain-containing protein [Gemmatimonadaceae bacterium]